MIQPHRPAVEESPPTDGPADGGRGVCPGPRTLGGAQNKPDRRPLVALISSSIDEIAPAGAAFAELFPAATLWNVVDDGLPSHGTITVDMEARMRRLIDHALREGADAVLVTCPAYAVVAHRAAAIAPVPVMVLDDAVILGPESLSVGATKVPTSQVLPTPSGRRCAVRKLRTLLTEEAS
jgi:hypothetical protein